MMLLLPAKPESRLVRSGGRHRSRTVLMEVPRNSFSNQPDSHSWCGRKLRSTVATILIFHEVDDVEAWLASPRRGETGKQLGWRFREFVDPAGSNRVGLIVEVDDADAALAMISDPAAMEPAKLDGVRLDTGVALVEG
jgi:hypothetical protein